MLLSLGNMTNVIKDSVQNKQDTLYNKTQVEESKAASSKEISNPIHTIMKTNTYLKSKEQKFLSHKHIYYRQNKKTLQLLS